MSRFIDTSLGPFLAFGITTSLGQGEHQIALMNNARAERFEPSVGSQRHAVGCI